MRETIEDDAVIIYGSDQITEQIERLMDLLDVQVVEVSAGKLGFVERP